MLKSAPTHSCKLVNQLGQEQSLILIDTRPALDGHHEKFIDLVHLTQEGRESLAEAIYDAIKAPIIKLIGATRAAE
jgi:hypothetical protein